MLYACGHYPWVCKSEGALSELLCPLNQLSSAKEADFDFTSIPPKLKREGIKFDVRLFNLTPFEDCQKLVLILVSNHDHDVNEITMILIDDLIISDVKFVYTGSIKVKTNVSLGNNLFTCGYLTLIPGKNKVLVFDFKSECAMMINLGSGNDSDTRLLPFYHGNQPLVLKQSESDVKLFGLKKSDDISSHGDVWSPDLITGFKIGPEFAGIIVGITFPFCPINCESLSSSNDICVCKALIITKSGYSLKVDNRGLCVQKVNLNNPNMRDVKICFLPSSLGDYICVLSGNGTFNIINIESMQIEKSVDDVEKFFVGNFLQTFYHQILYLTKKLDIKFIDAMREIDFENCFPNNSQNSHIMKKQVAVTISRRAESLQAVLESIRLKNLSLASHLNSVSVQLQQACIKNEFESLSHKIEMFGCENKIVFVVNHSVRADGGEKSQSVSDVYLVPCFEPESNVSCYKTLSVLNPKSKLRLFSMVLDNFSALDFYRFLVLTTNRENEVGSVVGSFEIRREQLLKAKHAPELKSDTIPVLQELWLSFKIEFTNCAVNFGKLFETFITVNEIFEIEDSQNLYKFSAKIIDSCFFVLNGLCSDGANMVVTVKTQLQLEFVKNLINDAFSQICFVKFK